MKTTIPNHPMARVLSLRDFRLLFAGAATSLLGDQFTLIATPWLVLKLTHDPLALGIVLALEGIPRALLMLVGGAVTDALSPRRIMLIANVTRCFLTAIMALLVFASAAQIWMIYAVGLAFGIVAGFAIPAENSMVPVLVGEQDLQAGNALMMGSSQIAGFVGPTIAGILIGRFSNSYTGVGLAFTIDALTFVVSAVTLQLIRGGSQKALAGEAGEKERVWGAILAGIRYVWTDKILRMMFLVLMAVNVLMMGPLMVGIPVLASERLPEGAVAYGFLMSAFAGGILLGYLIAGSLPRPGGAGMRWILVSFIAAFGLVIGALGYIPSTWTDVGLLLVLGAGNGYIAILLFTWVQTRTRQTMLGRIMGLLMLASTGLAPLSQAAAGALSKWNLTCLFLISGLLVLLVSLWMAFHPDLKEFSADLIAAPAEPG